MGRQSDWDEELSKDTKQRRNNRRRRKTNADQNYMDNESSEFIKSLESSKAPAGWLRRNTSECSLKLKKVSPEF